MTAALSAPVAHGHPPAPSRPGPTPLRRLGPAAVALVTACVLAVVTPGVTALVTALLAAVLLAVTAAALVSTRQIVGKRPVPWWYDGATIVAAAVVLVAWGLVDGWSDGAVASVATLLALAPGALVIASELPLWQAAHRGGPEGATLLSTTALPAARATDTLALDGLDTLVAGKAVKAVDPTDDSHLRNLRWFAGALAHRLETPQGRAVARLSSAGNVTDIAQHEHGISGSVDRHPTRLGSPTWIGLPEPEGPWEVLGLEVDGRALGTITVSDVLRPSSDESVVELRAAGVEVVLVADETERSRAIAELGGIERIDAVVPAGAALLSPTTAEAPLLLGPQSGQVRLEHADLVSAALALELCRASDLAQRRGTRIGWGWHCLAGALAAGGLLTDWLAAAAALVGVGLAAAVTYIRPVSRNR